MTGVTRTVVVVGAGCAGTLTAVDLLRRPGGPLRVVLVERRGSFGPGVAYSTPDARHLLNVAAERMSAFPGDPGHFAAWAADRLGPLPAGAYLPRGLYGDYLRALLDDAERSAAPGRCLERVVGEAVDVVPGRGAALGGSRGASRPMAGGAVDGGAAGGAGAGGAVDGATVVLADGRAIAADAVVLALGGLPAAAPVALPDDPRVVGDPWAPGALAGAPPAATTLLIGSGLTAVDVAVACCGDDGRGRVVAISRGGCLPHEQLPGLRRPVPSADPPPAPATVERLERWLGVHVARARRAGADWRDALDGVRPHAQTLWRSLPDGERRRFVRERARAWEVRRHRMAPEVGGRVRELVGAGRLLVRAGRALAVRALPRTVELLVDDCGEMRTLRADRVVVCAGAGTDVARAGVPLVDALLRRGLASPDPLGLGLRASPEGALVGADGAVRPRLHLLGPLRRGELWETTAVGEIRVQAQVVSAAAERGIDSD
ncbi:FAD/NAD(P)-binding protein [Conexibacter arvalis]|uniref:Putative NAD(P)/FAD-binding protein YdhS n=1 Tax=Conexibacter arvalis TaxID=912552 RepID=A0A840IBG8_9ACTN|nr:FAD/NAD(P)-binding protein [Conexibacter arvalis]MBB4662267.1 putative NAD(P)/FAD-binding protein YdhS [Conexibacter arvalis]